MLQHKSLVRKRIEDYLKKIKKTDLLLKDVTKEDVNGLFDYMRKYRNRGQIKGNGEKLAALVRLAPLEVEYHIKVTN